MLASRSQLDRSLELLHVSESSSWDDIQKEYRQLVQKWHPDRYEGEQTQIAHRKFIEITGAFKLLREHYHLTGSVPRPSRINSEIPLNLGKRIGERSSNRPVWIRTALLGTFVVTLIFSVLWLLDYRQTEKNRDKAHSVSSGIAKH